MSEEILGEVDNEIVNNPNRFDYNDILARREAELKHYDSFFGVDDVEEIDNDAEEYFDGFS